MVETLARVRQGFGLQNEPEVDQEKEEPERQALEAEYRATSGILKSAAVRWATHGIGPTTIDAALRLLGKAYVTWTAKQLQDPVLLQAVLATTPMELLSKPVNAPADRRHILESIRALEGAEQILADLDRQRPVAKRVFYQN